LREYLEAKKYFEGAYYSNNLNVLKKLILDKKIKIIHIFQDTRLVKEIYPFCKEKGVKVIFEDEDPAIYNFSENSTEIKLEREICRKVAGVIASTEMERKDLVKKYNLANTVSIYPSANKQFIISGKNKDIKNITCVYIGTMGFNSYRAPLPEYVESLARNKNIKIHLYLLNLYSITGLKLKLKFLKYKNIVFHNKINFTKIKKEISKYQYGIVAYDGNCRKVNNNFGFKTIEYVFSGLIPIYNTEKIYKSEEIGYVVQDGVELEARDVELKRNYFEVKYKKNLQKLSKDYIMENNIIKLEKFYLKLLSKK